MVTRYKRFSDAWNQFKIDVEIDEHILFIDFTAAMRDASDSPRDKKMFDDLVRVLKRYPPTSREARARFRRKRK